MAEHEEIRGRLLARRMPQRIESPRHEEAPTASKSAAAAPPSRAGGSLLQLQRQYGNRYVQRVVALARSEAEGGDAMRDVEHAIESSRGGGQALDRGAQSQMGEAMGAD